MRTQGASRPTLVAVTGWGQQPGPATGGTGRFRYAPDQPVDPAVIMALAGNPDTPALQAYAL